MHTAPGHSYCFLCLPPAWLQGMVSVVDPASSWCAKWLHLK